MPTLGSVLHSAAARLAGHCDAPLLEAQLLLTHALGRPRSFLYAWPESEIEPATAGVIDVLVERRARGEPLAYILGSREFWSRPFLVSPAVLIPRPETELLVELALERLPAGQAACIADLGTGSGILAITLALERPRVQVLALDHSLAALCIARTNARRLEAASVRFACADWLDALAPAPCFDLIVSNPPYVAANDPHLGIGDLRFEPLLALAAGEDGSAALQRIIRDARGRLVGGGWLVVEHGHEQGQGVRRMLHAQGYHEIETHPDLAGIPRATTGRAPRA